MTPLSGILEGGRSNVPLQNHHRSAATIDIGETARHGAVKGHALSPGGWRSAPVAVELRSITHRSEPLTGAGAAEVAAAARIADLSPGPLEEHGSI